MTKHTDISNPTAQREWRCMRCFKLLGKREGDHVHLRFTRGHEYIAALPATAICRGCGTLNALRSTTRT